MTNDKRGLRRAVTEHYGALARKAAGANDDAMPLIMVGPAADACCDDSCCIPEGMEDPPEEEGFFTRWLPVSFIRDSNWRRWSDRRCLSYWLRDRRRIGQPL